MRDNIASNVMMIPAKRRAGKKAGPSVETPKLRVAAYCRVSTDSDEQAGSYEAQVEHYTEYISSHPDWELAGIYADDGISGTNTKKREEFNRMIDDCMAGKIDRVITKSISRFARNTIDCLRFVRKLREKNIAIIFEKENINTLEASGELLLTIMASLAQQESASISQNVKMGLQFRYQEGKVQVNHNHFLGYTKDENGQLIIKEDEAVVVRRIFREYLDGYSLRDIADGLERDGIRTGGKKLKWHLSTILTMLQNEKYMGDALLQKTVTTDFIEKIRIKNDGTVPQYYVRDSQEAIIPRDIFSKVQEEILRRTNIFSGEDKTKRRLYSSKYALSSICICPKCGDIYRRTNYNVRGKKSVVWRCCTRMSEGPSVCDAPTVKETELQEATVKAINLMLRCSPSVKETLMENIQAVVTSDNDAEIEALNAALAEKQDALIQHTYQDEEYDGIVGEMDILLDKKQKAMAKKAEKENLKRRIKELHDLLDSLEEELTEYDEVLVRKYIDHIEIHEDRFNISFKGGIDLDVKR